MFFSKMSRNVEVPQHTQGRGRSTQERGPTVPRERELHSTRREHHIHFLLNYHYDNEIFFSYDHHSTFRFLKFFFSFFQFVFEMFFGSSFFVHGFFLANLLTSYQAFFKYYLHDNLCQLMLRQWQA